MATTYSIIIPAYNENKRLGATLEQVFAFILSRQWDAEVIVVDDGSRDQTPALVRGYARQHPELRLLENGRNRGKGYSVRHGMLEASGELLLFSDADLASPIEESAKLFAALEAGADIAIGSRWLRPELQKKRQSPLRQLYGRMFNLALRILLRLDFKDTQCGFKAFTRRASRMVFPSQRIERWGFDPEILFLARRSGLKIREVPVAWSHVAGTRISPLRDGLRMFGEVLKIRWNAFSGRYSLPAEEQARE
ncbi:MAG: glycosyltransferase family 2 protein [Acidobacteria bacterium]|nr:glycosyltransferase family 2 protein [Acidobacteriota bacterium]MBV9622392.1 glycosyltransferase family 2 protein [Acidobacteriota bacterium]